MIYSEMIHQSIDYIMKHLDEDIAIGDVAAHCHFSKYHFSRIFKAETGESLYAFIKRMKLEQSAIRLKLEKDTHISQVGIDYGYSASNYSWAFRQHHHLSPGEFRQSTLTTTVPYPFQPNRLVHLPTFQEYDERIRIGILPDYRVICRRYIGNYIDLVDRWREFLEENRDQITEGTLLMERFYDDPTITRVERCMVDLCMTANGTGDAASTSVIKGGRYAVYRYEGAVRDIFTAIQGVFSIWLPGSDHQMEDRYGLNIYRSMDPKNLQVVMDLCIPIKQSKNSEASPLIFP